MDRSMMTSSDVAHSMRSASYGAVGTMTGAGRVQPAIDQSPLERLNDGLRHLHNQLRRLEQTLYAASGQLGGPDCPPPQVESPQMVMRPIEAIGNGIESAAEFAHHLDGLARNVLREVVNLPD